MKEVKPVEEISRDTCLIYQSHPVAHAGIEMEYADSKHKLRKCEVTIKLTKQYYKRFLQMNVALMSRFPYFQDRKDVSF